MRLIDADAIYQWYTNTFDFSPNEIRFSMYDIRDNLYNIPTVLNLPSAQPEIIRCKDCKHFEYDHIENVNGIPLIVAHEICMRWCEGVKTSENGYCFLAERKDNE